MTYNWAVNESKVTRAVLALKKSGVTDPTEQQVKDLYVRYGGLVEEQDVLEEDVNEEIEAPKAKKTKKVS